MVTRRTLVHAVRLCLISGATHSTAPAAGDHLVRAHHLNSFYKFSPDLLVRAHHLNSFYIFPPNLLLRRSSHNYCCSAPIVQQHLRALLYRSLIGGMLQSRPPNRAWEGVNHFCGEVNLSSHLHNLAKILRVGREKQRPTEFRKFCRSEFPCFGAHSAPFTKNSPQKFYFFVFNVVSVSHKGWPKGSFNFSEKSVRFL